MGVVLSDDPSVTSLTPETDPGVDAPDLDPPDLDLVFFFLPPESAPPLGRTLARSTAPAAPSASAARTLASMRLCDSSLPALTSALRLALAAALAFSAATRLFSLSALALALADSASFISRSLRTFSSALALIADGFGPLRRLGLVRLGLLLRFLRRGGRLGVGP